MRKSVFLGAMTVAGLAAGMSSAATIDDVKARGSLKCGSNEGLAGFAAPDANGARRERRVGRLRRLALPRHRGGGAG